MKTTRVEDADHPLNYDTHPPCENFAEFNCAAHNIDDVIDKIVREIAPAVIHSQKGAPLSLILRQ
jgi:hypothetical protein